MLLGTCAASRALADPRGALRQGPLWSPVRQSSPVAGHQVYQAAWKEVLSARRWRLASACRSAMHFGQARGRVGQEHGYRPWRRLPPGTTAKRFLPSGSLRKQWCISVSSASRLNTEQASQAFGNDPGTGVHRVSGKGTIPGRRDARRTLGRCSAWGWCRRDGRHYGPTHPHLTNSFALAHGTPLHHSRCALHGDQLSVQLPDPAVWQPTRTWLSR
jgi:hypothetical protein